MRHHYPKNLSPRQKKITDVVHGTRHVVFNKQPHVSYCGRHAMRAAIHKALVTCKTCLRLMTEAEAHAARVKAAEDERRSKLGLTKEEQGIP